MRRKLIIAGIAAVTLYLGAFFWTFMWDWYNLRHPGERSVGTTFGAVIQSDRLHDPEDCDDVLESQMAWALEEFKACSRACDPGDPDCIPGCYDLYLDRVLCIGCLWEECEGMDPWGGCDELCSM